MTKQEESTFKKVVIDAFSSKEAQNAIVSALGSKAGQEVIKSGALAAFKSDEGQEILVDSFIEGYNEIAQPTIEDMWDDIRELKTEVKHIGDKHNIRLQRLERKIGVVAS